MVIPVYNRVDLICQTLSSLLAQTLPAAEIMVVDDGSDDGSAEAVEEMLTLPASDKMNLSGGQPWPEIRVIRQENAGPAAARNRGFSESRGEFIHFFDSDDIAAPNKHEVQVRALQESRADIAIGPWIKGRIVPKNRARGTNDANIDDMPRCLRNAKQSAPIWRFEPQGRVLQQRGLPGGDLLKALLTNWAVVPHCCMFHRDIVEKAGGFPTDCFGTEDTFFFMACLLEEAKCVHSPGTLELYRLNNLKITDAGDGNTRHLLEWAKVLIKMQDACSTRGIEPAHWFGFRARCWWAMRQLMDRDLGDTSLIVALEEASKGSHATIYRIHALWNKLQAGLKQRALGGREQSQYRAGPLTQGQLATMRKAGYSLQS